MPTSGWTCVFLPVPSCWLLPSLSAALQMFWCPESCQHDCTRRCFPWEDSAKRIQVWKGEPKNVCYSVLRQLLHPAELQPEHKWKNAANGKNFYCCSRFLRNALSAAAVEKQMDSHWRATDLALKQMCMPLATFFFFMLVSSWWLAEWLMPHSMVLRLLNCVSCWGRVTVGLYERHYKGILFFPQGK